MIPDGTLRARATNSEGGESQEEDDDSGAAEGEPELRAEQGESGEEESEKRISRRRDGEGDEGLGEEGEEGMRRSARTGRCPTFRLRAITVFSRLATTRPSRPPSFATKRIGRLRSYLDQQLTHLQAP